MPSSRSLITGLFLTTLTVLLLSQGIESRSLWASHEARAAQNAQTMWDRGNWLLPHLYDGTAELQKPAGFYWLVASVAIFRPQVDEVAVRLPVILAAFGMVLGLWCWFRQQGRPIAGFVAASVLVTAVHFTGTARIGRIDVPLAAAIMGILLTFHQPLLQRRWQNIAIGSLFVATALLLKGPIGLVLAGAVCAVSLMTRSRSTLVIASWQTMLLTVSLGVLLACPWYLAVHQATSGEFTWSFFWYHHINRAFGGAEALAAHPWWFYLPRLAMDLLPWTPLLVVALFKMPKGDPVARFGVDWLVAMLLVLSASRFKRADYLIPAYPAVAIVIGCWAERWWQHRQETTCRWVSGAFVAMLLACPLGWYLFDQQVTMAEQAKRDPIAVAKRLQDLHPPGIVFYRVENHLLAYQIGRPIRTLTAWDDVLTLWKSEPHHLVVLPESEVASLPPGVETVFTSREIAPQMTHRPIVVIRRTP